MLKFVFDLDGTLTSKESLPFIANHFGLQDQIALLTRQSVTGTTPFIESFITRVNIMRELPVSSICDLLATMPLYEELVKFISNHKTDCLIATGNLRCWVKELLGRIGCDAYCSEAQVINDQIIKITSILDKADLVQKLQARGYKVVFIGDSNNDMEAMRIADIAIISCLTQPPPPPFSLQTIGGYLILEENCLCRFLEQLYSTAPA